MVGEGRENMIETLDICVVNKSSLHQCDDKVSMVTILLLSTVCVTSHMYNSKEIV